MFIILLISNTTWLQANFSTIWSTASFAPMYEWEPHHPVVPARLCQFSTSCTAYAGSFKIPEKQMPILLHNGRVAIFKGVSSIDSTFYLVQLLKTYKTSRNLEAHDSAHPGPEVYMDSCYYCVGAFDLLTQTDTVSARFRRYFKSAEHPVLFKDVAFIEKSVFFSMYKDKIQ